MSDKKVREIVITCLSNINLERLQEEKIEFIDTTPLLKEGGVIDSMELVSVVVDIESEIENILGLSISLTDDESMDKMINPFDTVGNLIAYVILVVQGVF